MTHLNSSKVKLPKLEELLQPSDEYEQLANNLTGNINSLNNLNTPSRSEYENKGSSELRLQEEDSYQNLRHQKSSKLLKERDYSRKNTPSLAEMMININNNNNSKNKENSSNQTSYSSQKTIPKPFNKNSLINKSQLKLASYIEKNKDITLIGTKRFTDKSGEYYLKNVQLQKKQDKKGPLSKKLSLNHPQNLDNCFSKLNGNINKIRRNATKIITILPENSLTPIPVKEQNSVRGMAQIFNKRQYENAERVAVFIRRMEYSNGMKSHFKSNKKNNEDINKIVFIQQWWKIMYKILTIQRWSRGFLFRKNLMKILEHQENILKFITTFYNIHGFHLYRNFFDNLKKICNHANSKKTEMLEDFSEKMEKIEIMNNLRKLRNKMLKWKNIIMNEKADKFRKNNLMRKGIKGLKMNYILKLLNDTMNENKKELLNEIYNNKKLEKILKAISKLKKGFKNINNNDIKKEIFARLKIFYFMHILLNLKENIDYYLKKETLEKLKKLNEYLLKDSIFKKWKRIIDLNRILKNLIIKRKKELDNNKKLLLKAFSKWKNIKERKDIIEHLKNNNGNQAKKPQFKKIKIKLKKKESNIFDDENNNNNNSEDNNNSDINKQNYSKDDTKTNEDINLKKEKTYLHNYLNDNNQKNGEDNLKSFKKRISYRRRKKKNKKNKIKGKLSKLKKVVLLLLIKIYENQNNKLIKKYFDKWKKNTNNNNRNQKYVKKIVIGNSLNISKDSKLSDNSKNDIKIIKTSNTFNKDILPKENLSNINPDMTFDKIRRKNEQLLDAFKNNEKDVDSDDTSINVSRMSGMNLEEVKCENLKPIIYTSQSFVIDKNAINNIQKELPQMNYYKNINNKYPMKMSGDFRQLIDKNKDLLKNANPRIQITNAKCELDQFSPQDGKNTNINNINILNLNPNISINMNHNYKKKDLKKVVRNCDKDIYQQHEDYEKEKQRWISMSIPLDDDMANWEFLNSVKAVRNKNDINKFEIIQKNKSEKNVNKTYNIKNIPKKNKFKEDSTLQNIQYQLKEMNYKQFYKSDEDNDSPIKLVKYDKQNNNYKNRKWNNKFYSFDINNRNKYIDDNIEEVPEDSLE